MRQYKSQSGFSAIETVLVILLIGLLLFVGYVFYNNQLSPDASTDTSQSGSSNTEDEPTAPEINSESDLDNANDTLDQVDVEESNSSDEAQLDSNTPN